MEIALQIDAPSEPMLSVDCESVYFGEAGCAERFSFLDREGLLAAGLQQIRRAGKKAGLIAPMIVAEKDHGTVHDILERHLPLADRVLTADLGLVAGFGGRVPMVFFGAVSNAHTAAVLVRRGVDRIRMSLPYTQPIRDVGADADLEIVVFGSLPLSFTPTCHRLVMTGQGACNPRCVDEEIVLRRGRHRLKVKAKSLVTERPVNLTGRVREVAPFVHTFVIDTTDLSVPQVRRVVQAVREERAYVHDRKCFDGIRDCGDRDILSGRPWNQTNPTLGGGGSCDCP